MAFSAKNKNLEKNKFAQCTTPNKMDITQNVFNW